ncbi:hypothetical protein [Streptomyces sp. NPDC046887]|uniref:coiled-coil domain-containing protein n=1 Tax=Streptomyces sp. NPDC046887 TaxID=3155472 RepID=UPI0033E50C25
MPRGRHRHSPPLHRLLPPSAVAGAAVLSAAAAWLPTDPLVLRLLAAAAAAAAVTGAVLMRGWDRAAGRRVAELTRARAGDQWRTEERIAELETDLEESRELRAKLDAKLRTKRVELAGLRNEHAELLRRYATAETERASALEGRRQLALEAAAPDAPAGSGASAGLPALPAARSTPTANAYRQAARALAELTRNAATQEAAREAEGADAGPAAREGADTDTGSGAGADAVKREGSGVDAAGRKAASVGAAGAVGGGEVAVAGTHAPDAGGPWSDSPVTDGPGKGGAGTVGRGKDGPVADGSGKGGAGTGGPGAGGPGKGGPGGGMRAVPPAAAIVPARRRGPVPRLQGGFDFFGAGPGQPDGGTGAGSGAEGGASGGTATDTGTGAGPGAVKDTGAASVGEDEDLADVVGEEALAHHQARRGPERRAVGKVIDLTAHDETEQIDVVGLRRNAVG